MGNSNREDVIAESEPRNSGGETAEQLLTAEINSERLFVITADYTAITQGMECNFPHMEFNIGD